MKKLNLIIFLLLIAFGVKAQNYPGTSFTAKSFMNSPVYKLSGVSLDSANTVKRGFFTPTQYNKLQTSYGWGNHSGLYKEIDDSVNLSGFATQYDLSTFSASQWTTSGSNIYYTTGKVGIGTNNPTSSLHVFGSAYFRLTNVANPFTIYDTTNHTNVVTIDVNNKDIYIDDSNVGYKIGIGGVDPTHKLHVAGEIKATSYIMQQGIYAGIYVADASTAQSIANGVIYTKSTAFTTNGLDENCTSDAANDKITITKTGKYMVMGTCSFTSGTNSVVWYSAAFLGGTELANIHWARKVGTGSDLGSASFMGIINVTSVPTDLDVRFRQDQAGAINLTVVYSNLTVNYIGE